MPEDFPSANLPSSTSSQHHVYDQLVNLHIGSLASDMPSIYAPTRQRKHKVLARQKNNRTPQTEPDPNQDIITATKSEREARRQQLRAELKASQNIPRVSAKKQKRLDKYVDNKLKHDENRDLLKKLAAEKRKYDPSSLHSSKTLGKRSFREFVDGQIGDLQRLPEAKQLVVKQVKQRNAEDIVDDLDGESVDSFEAEHARAFDETDVGDDLLWIGKKTPVNTGSGLAQPLQLDDNGLPIITKREDPRKTKRLEGAYQDSPAIQLRDSLENGAVDTTVQDEQPWEGFDSEGELENEEEIAINDSSGRRIDPKVLDALLDALEDDEESELATEDDNSTDDEHTEAEPSDDEMDGRSAADSEESLKDDSSVGSRSGSDTSETSTENIRLKPRVSAFKTWATQQLNTSMGHTPFYEQISDQSNETVPQQPGVKPAAGYRVGLPAVQPPPDTIHAYHVQVERNEAIQQARQALPILQREQEIMEAINNNSVVVLKGDTGSGKTTQLPQFLYEAGYGDKSGPNPGLIGITQPRRVAAVSMARRVAQELGSHGDRVAHQIRFDTTVSSKTAMKFMTDGILLRELSQDLLLRKYSAIVIDEAHERSVNTDLLIGLLSKIVPARVKKSAQNPDPKPLKLIIMSATLNINDFLHEKLFAAAVRPPIVVAEGRQHKVTTHFALRSRPDYLEETIEKVKRAHRKLPPGGILVFLTGQQEIKHVLSRLRKEIRQSSSSYKAENQPRMHVSAADTPLELDDLDIGVAKSRRYTVTEEDQDDFEILVDEEEADKEFDISDDEEGLNNTFLSFNQRQTSRQQTRDPYDTVHMLPLYSQLPSDQQLRVFEEPPDRSRLIVLATNVAETSLTIPNIRYVFDCGRAKEKTFNPITGVQSFEIDYISKASAAQRAGRAGRTGPGHCWRLYSSAIYERYFPEHGEPEILRTPAENVVLMLKGLRYPKPVVDFPFPSAPSREALYKAEKLLKNLGALSSDGKITDLGKQLTTYPLSPRLAKILINAVAEAQILPEVITLVAALTVDDIFIQANQLSTSDENDADDRDSEEQQSAYNRAHAAFSRHSKTTDALKSLAAVRLYLEATNKETFCQTHFLRSKAMQEINQLISQLRSLLTSHQPTLASSLSASGSSQQQGPLQLKDRISSKRTAAIEQCLASGYLDHLAIRYDLHPSPPLLDRPPRRAIDVPYIPLHGISLSTHSSSDSTRTFAFIHPSSILARCSVKSLPGHVVYRYLQTSQPQSPTQPADSASTLAPSIPKTRLFPLTTLSPSQLLPLLHHTTLLEYGKPIPKTAIQEISTRQPRERICWVSTAVRDSTCTVNTGEVGIGASWPLPPCKVRQVLDSKDRTGWRVVEILS